MLKPSVTRVIYTAHLDIMLFCEKTLDEKFDLEATGTTEVLALQEVFEGRILLGKGHGETLWVSCGGLEKGHFIRHMHKYLN